MKLCKNCEHFNRDSCTVTSTKEIDPVEGYTTYHNKQSARLMRREGSVCGPDAKLFKKQRFRVNSPPKVILLVSFAPAILLLVSIIILL
jgi:hypothetical protein